MVTHDLTISYRKGLDLHLFELVPRIFSKMDQHQLIALEAAVKDVLSLHTGSCRRTVFTFDNQPDSLIVNATGTLAPSTTPPQEILPINYPTACRTAKFESWTQLIPQQSVSRRATIKRAVQLIAQASVKVERECEDCKERSEWN